MRKFKVWLLPYILLIIVSILLTLFIFAKDNIKEKIYLEISKGNIYEAEKLVYEVLKNDPNNPDALFAKVIIILHYVQKQPLQKRNQAKYQECLDILDLLSKRLNGFYYYHYIRAKVLEEMGKVDQAMKEYDNCIYHNPKFTDCYISISMLEWKRGNIDQAFEIARKVQDKYKSKMLISWYYYQLHDFDQSLNLLQQIIENPVIFKQVSQNRNVLNELYFQIMWISYRAGKSTKYWIEQNKKYNTSDYQYELANILDMVYNSKDEEAARNCLYNISRFPYKPYSYFILYTILKKHDKAKTKNYIFFLRKAVEMDLYNLDFKKVLEKEK
ncbi:MAG: hypothetical protein ABDH21_05085 [bacterium]